MKYVYVVTDGFYDDISIDAVFDSEEAAREFIKLHKDQSEFLIHKLILNPKDREENDQIPHDDRIINPRMLQRP